MNRNVYVSARSNETEAHPLPLTVTLVLPRRGADWDGTGTHSQWVRRLSGPPSSSTRARSCAVDVPPARPVGTTWTGRMITGGRLGAPGGSAWYRQGDTSCAQWSGVGSPPAVKPAYAVLVPNRPGMSTANCRVTSPPANVTVRVAPSYSTSTLMA